MGTEACLKWAPNGHPRHVWNGHGPKQGIFFRPNKSPMFKWLQFQSTKSFQVSTVWDWWIFFELLQVPQSDLLRKETRLEKHTPLWAENRFVSTQQVILIQRQEWTENECRSLIWSIYYVRNVFFKFQVRFNSKGAPSASTDANATFNYSHILVY